MSSVSRHRFLATVAFVLAIVVAAFAYGKKKDKTAASVTQMPESKRARHALERLTFGARPGEVERVAALGVDRWIDLQLHPEKIDDKNLEARLAPFRTLRMNTKEIVENFPPRPVIKAVMEGRQPMPSDPVKRAVYRAQMERLEEKKNGKLAANQPAPQANNSDSSGNENLSSPEPTITDEAQAKRREDRMNAQGKAEELLELPPDQRMKEVLQMSPEEQRALASSLKGQKGDEFMAGMDAKDKETLRALNNPQQVVDDELLQAKLLRAIYSERQLDEVMTDFWFNHFNVFIGKGADRFLVTSYERDVIRSHALGKFEDLLAATAKSPAMLFYLDNWLSVGPESDVALGIRRNAHLQRRHGRFPAGPRQARAKGKRRNGLNENYGRELLELHTLGVNGGYTQKDVTELARVLTGWTIDQPQKGGGFKFEERMHEPGPKSLLGHTIKEHGEKEGLEVLHILAHHPSTAHFICNKLAMRFVSDNPPPALVESMAQTFLKKNGDIREVLQTMFHAPEFWSEEMYRAKLKSPLEFVVSAVRATNAELADALPLARQLTTLGMPLYGMQPPTGYPMKSEAWLNSSALLGRMNFSVALMSGKIRGVQVNADSLIRESSAIRATTAAVSREAALPALEASLLAGDVSRQTHEALAKSANNVANITGLILGSPEFQRK